jgi:hypothetical protein
MQGMYGIYSETLQNGFAASAPCLANPPIIDLAFMHTGRTTGRKNGFRVMQ